MEQKLYINTMLKLLAKCVNRSEMLVYSTIVINVAIADSRGRIKTYYIPFIVIDL
jgi:hypothetical protein